MKKSKTRKIIEVIAKNAASVNTGDRLGYREIFIENNSAIVTYYRDLNWDERRVDIEDSETGQITGEGVEILTDAEIISDAFGPNGLISIREFYFAIRAHGMRRTEAVDHIAKLNGFES